MVFAGVFKYVTMWECIRKASLLFPYLPPVQTECMRRRVTPTKEREMKKRRKEAEHMLLVKVCK